MKPKLARSGKSESGRKASPRTRRAFFRRSASCVGYARAGLGGWLCGALALALLSWAAANRAYGQSSITNLPAGVQDVIKLTRAGITEEVILAQLQNATYNLTSEELVYLSNQGLSQNVLRALTRGEGARPSAPGVSAGIPASGAPPAWARLSTPLTSERLHELLSPYGTWLQVPAYGSCWRPTAASADTNWRPYAQQGRWMYTDCGWYWHSDYSWGEIPFHYGRWFREKGTWTWVPGNAWAPAWVCWREAEDYIGWAPLPPTVVFNSGVGLQFKGAPVSDSGFDLAPESFTFVPGDHFWDRSIVPATLPPAKAAEVFKSSVVKNGYHSVNGVFAVEGVGRDRIAALTHREVKVETPMLRELRPASREKPGKINTQRKP
jgi:hypothetical protein